MKKNRQEAFNFEKRSKFSIRKLTVGVFSLAVATSLFLQDAPVAEAGVDVWDRQGNRISANDGSLVQENIGIIQYARGDRPERYANFDTFNIKYDIEEVNKNEHYVNVTMTFNARHDRFGRHFVLFNIPKSLYEPDQIIREEYYSKWSETPDIRNQFTTWTAEPTISGTGKWPEYKRYIRVNPNNVANNVNGSVGLKITDPDRVADRISIEDGRWGHDWTRIDWRYQTDTTPDTSHIYNEKIKNLSRSIYIDDRGSGSNKVIYKFRARVKDYNQPMNFILGYNQPAGGWNNYEAVFGETPDNRDYKDRFPLTTPQKTIVDSLDTLTQQDKNSIIQKIKDANPDLFGSTNSLKKPVILDESSSFIIPDNGTSGVVKVKYIDGTYGEIPISDVVTKRVVETPPTTPTTQPIGNSILTYKDNTGTGVNAYGNVPYVAISPEAKKWEDRVYSVFNMPNGDQKSQMTRIQLREKTETNMATINDASSLSLWNSKLNEIKSDNNIGKSTGSSTYPAGTVINGYGSGDDYNGAIYDMSMAHTSSASIKYTSDGKIEGIVIKGPRYDGQGDNNVEAGLITADMLFKQAPVANQLDAVKEQAKTEIGNINGLPDDRKEAFKNQVTGANSQEQIEEIVAEAKKEAADLAKAKADAKAKIDALKHLTPDQKNTFKTQIDQENTTDAINKKVVEATQENLGKAKDQGTATVTGLQNLPQDEKEAFNQQIAGADTPEKVKEIVDAAIAKDAAIQAQAEADKKKDEAKQVVDSITNLSEEDKNRFKTDIENATDPREIESIINEAQGKAIADESKRKIDELQYLNDAQKQAFKNDIDANKADEDINMLVTEARELDNAMKYLKELEEQADTVKASNKYRDASEETKQAFDNAKTAAEAVLAKDTGANENISKVNELINNLKKGIEGLAETPVTQDVNKQYLQEEYDKGNELKQTTKYTGATPEAKQNYDTAWNKAKEILDKQGATQKEVDAALNDLVQATSALDGQDPINRNPQVITQPTPIVVFKDTAITTPITTGEFKDDGSIANIKMMNSDGLAEETMGGLVVTVVDGQDGKKKAQISGTTTANAGSQERKLQITDNTDKTTLSDSFNVIVVDATLKDQVAIQKQPGTTLTVEDVKTKIQFSHDENQTAFDVILPDTLPTKGSGTVNVTVRVKPADNAPDSIKNNFVSQEKVIPVVVNFATYESVIVPTVPERVLIDTEAPTTPESKNAIIDALKNANTQDGTSKFPANTEFRVSDTGEVTISYPDGSTETVKVPFKQKDSEKYTPTAREFPLDSPAVQDQPLTDEEKTAIELAVTIPEGSQGTVSVPTDAKVKLDESNNPYVEVTVRYQDGTEDKVKVPVRQHDKAKYTPEVVKSPVLISVETTNGTNITNEKDKEEIKNNVDVPAIINGGEKPVVTKEIVSAIKDGTKENQGKKVVEVEITYADKTKEKIEVPVKQADKVVFTPKLKDTEEGKSPEVLISVDPSTNPDITKKADKTSIIDKVEIPNVGDKVAPVKSKEVTSAVKDGTGENTGKKVVDVTVTYEDGSQDKIEVPVKFPDNEVFEPKLKDKEEGKSSEALISVDPSTNPDITKKADKTSIIDKVEIPNVGDKVAPVKSKEVTSKVKDGTGENQGKKVVEVTVTYNDGTKDTIDVPVKYAVNENYEPKLKSDLPVIVDAGLGETLSETDKAKVIDNVKVPGINGGESPVVNFSIEDPTVVEKDGVQGVNVKVTYEDGSFDTIFVPVSKDSDKDGFSDTEETKANTNANDPKETPQGSSTADRLTPTVDTTEVEDINNLTNEEKEVIKQKVKDNNILPEGTDIVVGNDGRVTITYPDNSKDIIPASETVSVKDSDKDGFSDEEETKANTNANDPKETPQGSSTADRLTPTIDPVEVNDVNNLTKDEKDAVKKAIEDNNTLPNGTQIEVSDKGEVTINYPDGSQDKIEPTQTVTSKDSDKDGFSDEEETKANTNANDPKETPQGSSTADRLTPTVSPVEVKDTANLTEDEKEAVQEAVRNQNDLPKGTTITVENNGEVTITYPDGSQDNIEPTQTVKLKDSDKDGFSDIDEEKAGSNPNDPTSVPTGEKIADKLNPTIDPAVKVKDTANLTDDEKRAVEDAIRSQNDLPKGTTITVENNGKVIINYPDSSSDILEPETTTQKSVQDAPGASDVSVNDKGDVVIVPPGVNVTELAITYTPAGSENPVTVKVTKENGKWIVPSGSDLIVDDKGNIIIPADKVKGGTDVTVVAKNGDVVSEEVGSTVVPNKEDNTNTTSPGKPTVATNDKGDVVITPPAGDVTSIEVTYTPEGQTDPIKVTIPKGEDGNWKVPEGFTVNEKGEIVIPGGKVADGTPVTVVAKNGDTTSSEPETVVTPKEDTNSGNKPSAPTVATTPTGDVVITPPAGDVTSIEVTYTPEGETDPIKVTIPKGTDGTWTLPEGFTVNEKGEIVIPGGKVADGTPVTVVAKNGDTTSIEPETVVTPKEVTTSTTPVTPSAPTVDTTPTGDVVITPPAGDVTSIEVTYTPEGETDPIKVTIPKGPDGTWTLPNGFTTDATGNIVIPGGKVADGTPVTVVAKNGDTASSEPETVVTPKEVTTNDVVPATPKVTTTQAGDVVITPPAGDVTSIEVTYTPEGQTDPIKVTIPKGPDGTWTLPNGFTTDATGNIVIPGDKVADGTPVTVVAKNGDATSTEAGKAVTPKNDQTVTTPVVPKAPTVTTTPAGDVVITPPAGDVTSIEVTYTPEGQTDPIKVTIPKGPDGNWKVPEGFTVNEKGEIVIPGDKVADGTPVTAVSKNGEVPSTEAGTVLAPKVDNSTERKPETPTVATNDKGDVVITPPAGDVTSIEVTYTPEGQTDPVKVTIPKGEDGNWKVPEGFTVNEKGEIVIPGGKVADGTPVTVVAKNGDTTSSSAGTILAPKENKPAPETPKVGVDEDNNLIVIEPPKDNATSIVITFTPKGEKQPVSVEIKKDESGNWVAPEGAIPVVNPDGRITISVSEVENDTAVSVISKNGNTPSTNAETVLISSKTDAEKHNPNISEPINPKDINNLTSDEKQEIEDKIRKENVLPDRTVIVVGDDGTVTITYPDKSVDTILPTKTVMSSAKGDSITTEIPKYDLNADEDKDGFKNLEELEKGSNPSDPKSVPTGEKTADKLTPKLPIKTRVQSTSNLTDAEKGQIIDEITKANKDIFPEGTEIVVYNDGTVEIKYPDGSVDRILSNNTIIYIDESYYSSANRDSSNGNSNSEQLSDSNERDRVLANTGSTATTTSLAGLGLLAIASIIARRNKKNR